MCFFIMLSFRDSAFIHRVRGRRATGVSLHVLAANMPLAVQPPRDFRGREALDLPFVVARHVVSNTK
ncbi:hypothetical protein [Burkholderia metallica]|uniref:hypothetical protein n=1 Tax=Burkholderia metallica TaxID=488729 RepID=UPI00158B2710|nr:hypothetical protein [Burkholderia metallica]